MELSSKKLERTSRIVYYSISTILCIFPILLSNRIIGDLDNATNQPHSKDFEDKSVLAEFDKNIELQDTVWRVGINCIRVVFIENFCNLRNCYRGYKVQ